MSDRDNQEQQSYTEPVTEEQSNITTPSTQEFREQAHEYRERGRDVIPATSGRPITSLSVEEVSQRISDTLGEISRDYVGMANTERTRMQLEQSFGRNVLLEPLTAINVSVSLDTDGLNLNRQVPIPTAYSPHQDFVVERAGDLAGDLPRFSHDLDVSYIATPILSENEGTYPALDLQRQQRNAELQTRLDAELQRVQTFDTERRAVQEELLSVLERIALFNEGLAEETPEDLDFLIAHELALRGRLADLEETNRISVEAAREVEAVENTIHFPIHEAVEADDEEPDEFGNIQRQGFVTTIGEMNLTEVNLAEGLEAAEPIWRGGGGIVGTMAESVTWTPQKRYVVDIEKINNTVTMIRIVQALAKKLDFSAQEVEASKIEDLVVEKKRHDSSRISSGQITIV